MNIRSLAVASWLFLSAILLPADTSGLSGATPEDLRAPVLILADARSGEILYERGDDIPVVPASLAKLMTLYISLEDAERGVLDESGIYGIPADGSAEAMRPRSSVLGLREGDRATLLTLQRAAGIASANDAAWTLALLSSPTVDAFVRRMNIEADRIGMERTFFADPDGWSSLSRTCGSDMLLLAMDYLERHPDATEKIHSLPFITYSDDDLLAEKPDRRNTNLLLGRTDGVDGLKTGAIPGEVFNFIATAERSGTRLIALVMGIRTDDYIEGLRMRALEAEALLKWGFGRWETWYPDEIEPVSVPIRHGGEDYVMLAMENPPEPETVRTGGASEIILKISLPEEVEAPVADGDVLGGIIWELDGEIIAEADFTAVRPVDRRWRIRDFLGLRRTE